MPHARFMLLLIVISILAFFTPRAHAIQILIINETGRFAPATLESMTITGDLSNGVLYFNAQGYSLDNGREAKVYIAGKPEDVLVKDVVVNGKEAHVFFDEYGYYVVVRDGRFSMSGTIELRKQTSYTIFFPGPINSLRFDLKHGYVIGGPEFYGVTNRTVTLKEVFMEHTVSVSGAAKITVENTVTFRYVLDITSYGGVIGTFTLPLRNQEAVGFVSISGCNGASWRDEDDEIVLSLPCTNAKVVVRGTILCGDCKSINFVNPVNGFLKLMVEASPEKKLTVYTNARELDVSEAPLPFTYPNGRVFLLEGGQQVRVEVEELEKLPSLAATIDRVYCKQAITKDGAILTDCEYRYKNAGLDFIKIKLDGIPLYAEANNQPMKLTVEDGDLYLALPKSRSDASMEIMYFTSARSLRPLDVIHLPLPSTEVPTTQLSVGVYLPKDVYVLAALGGDKLVSELPRKETVAAFVIFVLFVGLTIWRDKRKLTMYLAVSAAIYMLSRQLFLIWIAATLLPFVKRNLITMEELRKMLNVMKFFVVLGIVIAAIYIVLSNVLFTGRMMTMSEGGVYQTQAKRFIEGNLPLVAEKSVQLGEEGKGKITVQLKEGIKPVKMEIPALGKVVKLKKTLITKERPVQFRLIIMNSWIIYVFYLIALYLLIKLLPDLKKAYLKSFPILKQLK